MWKPLQWEWYEKVKYVGDKKMCLQKKYSEGISKG